MKTSNLDPNVVNKFRSVSNLLTLEKLLFKQLTGFINAKNVIDKFYSDFRVNHITR